MSADGIALTRGRVNLRGNRDGGFITGLACGYAWLTGNIGGGPVIR